MKVCYWKEKIPGTYNADKRFPCFILTEGEESKYHIYGLPSLEYPGLVKVGHAAGHAPFNHGNGPFRPVCVAKFVSSSQVGGASCR